jgi:hypothetical protein
MNTPALTIAELARLMHRVAETAYDEDLRCTGDTDQAILGRLTMLDVICDPLWVSDHNRMTAAEEAVLGEAREALCNAYDFLKERLEFTALLVNAAMPELVTEHGTAPRGPLEGWSGSNFRPKAIASH